MEMTIYMFSCSFAGVLWALFGGIFILLWRILLGIVGEVIASKTQYQNYKALTVTFVLYAAACYLGTHKELLKEDGMYKSFWTANRKARK